MFYSGIDAAFRWVSALIGALTPAKGRKRAEGEAKYPSYMIQKAVSYTIQKAASKPREETCESEPL